MIVPEVVVRVDDGVEAVFAGPVPALRVVRVAELEPGERPSRRRRGQVIAEDRSHQEGGRHQCGGPPGHPGACDDFCFSLSLLRVVLIIVIGHRPGF